MQEENIKMLEEKNIHLWFYGSPLVLCSMQLYLNIECGELFADAKFLNVQPEHIKEITVDVICYNSVRKPIDYIIDYKYSGLDVQRNSEFGISYKIPVKNQETRNIEFILKSVTTTNDEIWYNSDSTKFNVSLEQKNIFSVQGDLNKGFQEICARDNVNSSLMVFQPVFDEYHWMCSCGCLNWNDEKVCSQCGVSKEWLQQNISEDTLKFQKIIAQREAEIIKEDFQKKAQQEKERQKEEFRNRQETYKKQIKKQKNRKNLKRLIAIISVLAVATGITLGVIYFLIPYISYLTAKDSLNNGQYDVAITQFEKMGDFLDSKDLLNKSIYNKADNMYKNGNKQESANLFKSLANYSDSQQKYYDIEYERAGKYYSEKDYMNAADIYRELGTYLDCEKRLNAAYENIYNDAVEKLKHKHADKAYEEFVYLGDYSDSSKMLDECFYVQANTDYTNMKYKDAIKSYSKISDYKDVPNILKKLSHLSDIISAADDNSPAVWTTGNTECPVCKKKDSATYSLAFGADGKYIFEMSCTNHSEKREKKEKFKIENDTVYTLEHINGQGKWEKVAEIISVEPLKDKVEGKNTVITMTDPFGSGKKLKLYGNIISDDTIHF